MGPWTLDPDALRPMVAGAVEEELGASILNGVNLQSKSATFFVNPKTSANDFD